MLLLSRIDSDAIEGIAHGCSLAHPPAPLVYIESTRNHTHLSGDTSLAKFQAKKTSPDYRCAKYKSKGTSD